MRRGENVLLAVRRGENVFLAAVGSMEGVIFFVWLDDINDDDEGHVRCSYFSRVRHSIGMP